MLQLAPARFEAQLRMMLAAGFEFVTVAELARRAAGGTPPPGLAAVSFDDGLRNNLTTAMPIARRLRVPATVYVPSGWIGGRNPWIRPGAGNEILMPDELRQLVDAGWELGSHTVSHADLSTLGYDDCRRELEESKAALERIARTQVETFAYPFGRYGPDAVRAVRDCGYRAAVTTGSGSWDRFELTRAMIGRADPFPLVLLKLTDRYEPLLGSKPLTLTRRASKRLRARLNHGGRSGTP
jgi:peptidoglycan/xylan/chitin deacetylase (PgdA/CDA1 family)